MKYDNELYMDFYLWKCMPLDYRFCMPIGPKEKGISFETPFLVAPPQDVPPCILACPNHLEGKA